MRRTVRTAFVKGETLDLIKHRLGSMSRFLKAGALFFGDGLSDSSYVVALNGRAARPDLVKDIEDATHALCVEPFELVEELAERATEEGVTLSSKELDVLIVYFTQMKQL